MLCVWGYHYVRQFLEFGLPTLLAPGNVPAVAAELPTEFVILTSSDDEAFISEHPTFKHLGSICKTTIHPIDHLITDGNYSTTITLAYTEAVRDVGEAMIDMCFFFLVADYIIADGSLANVLKRMQQRHQRRCCRQFPGRARIRIAMAAGTARRKRRFRCLCSRAN